MYRIPLQEFQVLIKTHNIIYWSGVLCALLLIAKSIRRPCCMCATRCVLFRAYLLEKLHIQKYIAFSEHPVFMPGDQIALSDRQTKYLVFFSVITI